VRVRVAVGVGDSVAMPVDVGVAVEVGLVVAVSVAVEVGDAVVTVVRVGVGDSTDVVVAVGVGVAELLGYWPVGVKVGMVGPAALLGDTQGVRAAALSAAAPTAKHRVTTNLA